MRSLLEKPWVSDLRHVFSSAEQKALDGAEILAASLQIPHTVLPELGENDRSTTGFLPPAEFWEIVEEFCDLKGAAISRSEEQPRPAPGSPPGSGGGYYLAFDAESRELQHGWRAIDS